MLSWTAHVKGGPANEHDHAAVAVGHRVYSFGSSGGHNPQRNHVMVAHVFNVVSLRWKELHHSETFPGRGERLIEAPSKRIFHTAVLIEHAVYIWGGLKCAAKEPCNVLHAFDVDTHRWFVPGVSSGAVPKARSGHSAAVLGKAMYVYGGYNHGHTMSDIHKFDAATAAWSLIDSGVGTPILASLYHSATFIGTKMFVFGECVRGTATARVFDAETNCWTRRHSAQLLPHGRQGHSAFAYNGELYIYGGENYHEDNQLFDDLWKFNPDTFSWTEVKPKGKGRYLTHGCCCLVGDRVILFGGLTDSDLSLYILDLSPSLKTLCNVAVIQYGLEQSGLPHDIRWELDAMTHGEHTRIT